ncbi:MAG: malto-oligosyltrehalose trehalohydrolase [Dehalococcoidia bacterium]|nr:malto-oligosyltrehalose trehalohydrolase [Dehalococcoidia bacterium]
MTWQPTLGAIVQGGGVAFRVWAPDQDSVELGLLRHDGAEERAIPMERDGEDWHVFVPGLSAGQRYRYRLPGGAFPDPCSRAQPEGVHGPSEVIDPAAFEWSDDGFAPPPREDLVIYELHIGTLTPGGTFDDAIGQLDRIRDLGVNAIEVMPVAAFPGRWNWGYDGVAMFAPAEVYGGPDAFRRFVDAAHARGLAVILDVVYNHFGPDGNYTGAFTARYTHNAHATPWGDALNYDRGGEWGMRRFARENLLHWHHEYHVDGFRLDATHAIFDESGEHILAELRRASEEHARGGQAPYLIAETGENDVRYLRPRGEGGHGFDGIWADDFHHAVRTLLRPEREGYLVAYEGSADELARTVTQGFLYEGQPDPYSGHRRGTPAREQPWHQFVYCLQNHDQVGNRAFGDRLSVAASRDDYLAATLLLLLLPQTPLLFQGQEFHASSPFLYFTDHGRKLGRFVTEGRRREFGSFKAFADPALRERIPDPQDASTFEFSKLDLREAEIGLGALCADFHRELLALRHEDPVLHYARRHRVPLETATADRAVLFRMSKRRAMPAPSPSISATMSACRSKATGKSCSTAWSRASAASASNRISRVAG